MGEEGSPNVSTCTNKEVAEGSMYRIGMNGGISQHVMRLMYKTDVGQHVCRICQRGATACTIHRIWH